MTKRYRRLSSELLEDRAVMVGNVTAEVVGNVLTITGDDGFNTLNITRLSATQVHLEAQAGDTTTVNGNAAGVDLNFAQNGALKLAMRGGTDNVRVNDGVTEFKLSGLSIDMGSGASLLQFFKVDLTNAGTTTIRLGSPDEVAAQQFVWSGMNGNQLAGNLNIVTGAGNDIIGLSFIEFARSLRIDTGAGDDDVNLEVAAIGRHTTIVAGAGKNDVNVADVGMNGSLRISGGEGDDQLTVSTVKAARADVRSFGGDDQITIADFAKLAGPVAAGLLAIDAGDGDDVLNLSKVTASNVRLRLGAGDEQLTSMLNTATTCRIDGGDGAEIVVLEQSTFGSLRADFAAGDDKVTAASGANVKITGRLRLLGGPGANLLDDDGLKLPANPAAVTIRDFTLV